MHGFRALVEKARDANHAGGTRGFTIVELLIVIVVIGILAALVLNSFSQAQAKARNSQTASVVTAYKKAIIAYAVENGSYPIVGAACLGDGYPDLNGDGSAGDCWQSPGYVKESVTLQSRLRPYTGYQKMLPNLKPISYGSFSRVGAILQTTSTNTLDGTTWPWWILYVMEGKDARCPVGPVASGPYPNWLSEQPANGYTEQPGTKAGTGCWMPLPDPSTV